jgi:hypothetical protein
MKHNDDDCKAINMPRYMFNDLMRYQTVIFYNAKFGENTPDIPENRIPIYRKKESGDG